MQIALRLLAFQVLEQGGLLLPLDALGDGGELECTGERYDRAGHRLYGLVAREILSRRGEEGHLPRQQNATSDRDLILKH